MATVTIQKRENKNGNSYVVTFKDPLTGKKKYYKTFKKHRIAHQEANELRALLDTGKSPNSRKKKFTTLTFHEVSESLKKEWADRLSRNKIAEKTMDEWVIWLNVLGRKYGKRILCDISTQEILDFRNNIAKKDSNVSSNKYLSIFRKVFKKGLELNAIIKDPTAEIKSLNEKGHERNRFILPHEVDSLIKATKQTRAKFYLPAIIYLGAEHGAAKQEVLGLKWSKIDFDYNGIGLITLYRTKTKMERTDSLMPRTKQALLDWRDHLKWMRHRTKIDNIKTDFVFCHLDGSPIKNFNKAWWRSLEIAGIQDFHFHDLRHTFCSNLLMAGGDLKDAKEMIGHSDIAMTDRYSHLTDEHKNYRQNQLAEHYESKN
jgi:integrase